MCLPCCAQLHATAPTGRYRSVLNRVAAHTLQGVLYMDHSAGEQVQGEWQRRAITLDPYSIANRLNALARNMSRTLSLGGAFLSRQMSAVVTRGRAGGGGRAGGSGSGRGPPAARPGRAASYRGGGSGGTLQASPSMPTSLSMQRGRWYSVTAGHAGPTGGLAVVEEVELEERRTPARTSCPIPAPGPPLGRGSKPLAPHLKKNSEASVLELGDGLGSLAVPGAEGAPLLVVEHYVLSLPKGEAVLPELDLGMGLDRQLHCYAHGGFMGLAISVLADTTWRGIVLEDMRQGKVRGAGGSG